MILHSNTIMYNHVDTTNKIKLTKHLLTWTIAHTQLRHFVQWKVVNDINRKP